MTYDGVIIKPSLDDVLEHHGIKGMRWGHRKQRIKKGRRRRYSIKTYEKYKKAGMTDEQAQKEAERKRKVAKVTAIAAGLTLAAIGGYALYKYKSSPLRKDINLKEGTVLQTLSANKDRLDNKDDNNYFYAAFSKRDKETYKAVWGKPINMLGMAVGDNKYNISSKIVKSTKVASQKSGMEIFKKLAESDEDFAKHIGYSPEMTKRLSKKGLNTYIKQRYMNFDYDLADHKNSEITGKFFKALKDAGYSGIVDSNDLKGAGGQGLKTKAPIIMFDHSSYVSDTIKQLSDMDINKAQASRQAKQATEAMLQMIIPYAGASAAATATGVAVNYDKNVIEKYKKKKETSK